MVLIVRGDRCTHGRSNLSPTSPYAVPGLYIDRDNPAQCSGQITHWRVCYYNPRKFTTRNSLQILLLTWRLKKNRVVRIGNHSITVDIPQHPDDFQCVNISVDPSVHIDVELGDYIAVYTFSNAVLPVIANTTYESHVYFYPTSLVLPSAINLVMNPKLVTLTDKAVYVSATIGKFFQLQLHTNRICSIVLFHAVNPSSEDTTSPTTVQTQGTNSSSTTQGYTKRQKATDII